MCRIVDCGKGKECLVATVVEHCEEHPEDQEPMLQQMRAFKKVLDLERSSGGGLLVLMANVRRVTQFYFDNYAGDFKSWLGEFDSRIATVNRMHTRFNIDDDWKCTWLGNLLGHHFDDWLDRISSIYTIGDCGRGPRLDYSGMVSLAWDHWKTIEASRELREEHRSPLAMHNDYNKKRKRDITGGDPRRNGNPRGRRQRLSA